MTYVPVVVPPTPPSPPSPRTRELAGLLKKVLEEYKKAHPATTKGEIRAALRLAQASAGGPKPSAALAILAGVLAAGALAGVLASQVGEGVPFRSVIPTVVMAVILLLGIILVVVRLRSD